MCACGCGWVYWRLIGHIRLKCSDSNSKVSMERWQWYQRDRKEGGKNVFKAGSGFIYVESVGVASSMTVAGRAGREIENRAEGAGGMRAV